MQNQFQKASPSSTSDDTTEVWRALGKRLRPSNARAGKGAAHTSHIMEAGISLLAALDEAPTRTPRAESIARASPLDQSVRTMFEQRAFGRRYDALTVDLDALPLTLPLLECPSEEVAFLACDRSLEDLGLSVDCLLQHRKRLVAKSVNTALPRRHVLVLGAGPGGLMVAIELSLRDHLVVVCEPRELYTRNRFIGVYKEIAHLMASLGMPESMTYDFTHYRGKRGIMLADIQTFLHGVALKLGVVIYNGAIARNLDSQSLRSGELELQRSPRAGAGTESPFAIGMTRWHYDTVSRVRSGVAIRFDTIVEASGGRSGLRDLAVGRDNVISLRTLGQTAAARDPSLGSYFDDPEDHCAKIVRPSSDREVAVLHEFAAALQTKGAGKITDELPCFVSNIDASIFKTPIRAVYSADGVSARIGDKELNIPSDWVIVECPLIDRRLTRYQIEGPLPSSFEYGGARLVTAEVLPNLNPVGFLLRILYAMGVPFEAIDRRKLIDFYTFESSTGDAKSVIATWVGSFRTLRLGGEQPIVWGAFPGSERVQYGIIGEALQNAWYRFGVGVDDTFASAGAYAESLELDPNERIEAGRRLEKKMLARGVQVLYHLYTVAQNTEQGVVGPVLTEYYLDDQHVSDLAEARLREVVRQGAEVLAAWNEVGGSHPLLDGALEYRLECSFRRVLTLLESFAYDPEVLRQANHPAKFCEADWRRQVAAMLDPMLSPEHRELVMPLMAEHEQKPDGRDGGTHADRLIEIAMGQYGWVTPWLRACALRALDPVQPGSTAAIERAAADPEGLVAETAAGLARSESAADTGTYLTVDKVLILKNVGIFRAIPSEVLAGVAALLSERRAGPGECFIQKGDLGDCLYVIASGRVRVHDGETTIAELDANQVVGELSLLDAEPRSASVTAVVPTQLFCLDQTDFYALMAERPEIVLAINRVLCEMVRTSLAVREGS